MQEERVAGKRGEGSGERVGELQAHDGVSEEDGGDDAELGKCGADRVSAALKPEMGGAGEKGDQADGRFAHTPCGEKQHADVDDQSQRGDEAEADDECAVEVRRRAEAVNEQKGIEECNGKQAFKPEAHAAAL